MRKNLWRKTAPQLRKRKSWLAPIAELSRNPQKIAIKQYVKGCLGVPAALFTQACALAALLAWSPLATAHGGVVAEEDTCLLRMGFLQAHFTLHQPESRGAEEFCEDLPDVGSSLFVVEYLHDMMKEMPIDFRIIRDEQGFGIFANWEDVASIADLEAQTVLHRILAPQPAGVLALRHTFEQPGGYIGIVVAENPDNGKAYNAVFYFAVGNAGYGWIPLFVGLVAAAQLIFWFSTGTLQRFIQRRVKPANPLA